MTWARAPALVPATPAWTPAGYAALGTAPGHRLPQGADHGHDLDGPGAAGRRRLDPGRPRLTRLADALEKFLLPLVLVTAAGGIAFPAPGRRAEAADGIVIALAILVFCTGTSMTFAEMGAVRTAGRRLAVVLPAATVGLPVLAWLASHLASGAAARGGILAAGLAPAEVASVALTGLAGGDAVLAAGLLAASTAATVLLAGPILSLAGAHSSASQLSLLVTLALVVALPLAAGAALRSADPCRGREQPLARVTGTVSLLVLLWQVASQIQVRASEAGVVLALVVYLAGAAALGALLARGAPPEQRTAIVLTTGMRDFAVAAGIAASAFGAAAAAPLGIYGLLVLVFGSAAAYAAGRTGRRKPAAGA